MNQNKKKNNEGNDKKVIASTFLSRAITDHI